jgi:CheY-like chemotaxis protein
MALNISDLKLSDKSIVIVEDDLPSVRYYETLLRGQVSDVKIFRNGREFIDYVSQGSPKIDIVFMDFLIPFINGIECLRVFRKEYRSTPVLMLTAYSSEQCKTEAYLAGCNEYVLKPIYPEKVYFLLEKYLMHEASQSMVF